MKYKLVILINILLITFVKCDNLPIVMWHGMGDSCCFPFSLGSIKKFLKAELNNVYVKSIKIGNSVIEDYESGFFIHPNKQITDACRQIADDPMLKNGYNAIGFSQGGQFLRAVAQRCPDPPMNNLITLGGQHQGVFGLPNCPSVSVKTCEYFRKLLNHAAYLDFVQNLLVQATYWHDPLNEDEYKQRSTFIAEINNEKFINQTYIDNLRRLKRFVMVQFTEDTIVQPKESQYFEFYKNGQDVDILPLKESELYLQDKLGLKSMMENNQISFIPCKGNHLQFTDEWFIDNLIPILKA